MRIDKYMPILKVIVGAALILGICLYLYLKKDLLLSLVSISILHIVYFTLIHLLNVLLLGAIHLYACQSLNINQKFNEWFGITVIANFLNLFMPAKAGTLVRLPYLKTKTNLALKDFLQILSYSTFLGMIGMGLTGGLLTYYSVDKIIFVTPYFILLTIGMVSMMSFPYLKKIFYSIDSLKIFLIFCLLTILYPVRTYLSFSSLGIGMDLSPNNFLQLSMINLLVSLLPLLPNNMGIKEIVIGQVVVLYGLRLEFGLLVSLLERISLLVTLIPFAIYYFYKLIFPLGISFIQLKNISEELRDRK